MSNTSPAVQWLVRYAAQAAADGHRCASRVWAENGHPAARPTSSVVHGTMACALLTAIRRVGEGRAPESFLHKQTLDPRRSRARYLVTFHHGEPPLAWLCVDRVGELDLAGLHDQFGFSAITVGRAARGRPLGKREADDLEAALSGALMGATHAGFELTVERTPRTVSISLRAPAARARTARRA